MAPSISSQVFGSLPDGRSVDSWILQGSGGLLLEVLSYGGIVRRIVFPDRNGSRKDLVLGYDNLDSYINDPFFMGAIVGRVAGRIAGGHLKVEGKAYDLPINDPPNHLHGGPQSLNRHLWNAEPTQSLNRHLWNAEPIEHRDGSVSIILSTRSPDGDQGYPGNLHITVCITVTPDNCFRFRTVVSADKTTPVSITHHSYFNLAGEGNGTVLQHTGQVHSDTCISCDEKMTLLDKLQPLDDQAADLRKPVILGERVESLWQQHGDLYWLSESKELKQAARFHEAESGRQLEVHTTLSCLQTYFAASLDGSIHGKSGGAYEQFGAFCLECENYPQAMHTGGFGEILVHPGQPQSHTTEYRFSLV